MIYPRPAAYTKLQYIKYFTSLPIVVLKSYGSSINAAADLGLMNGIQLAAEAKTVLLSTLSNLFCVPPSFLFFPYVNKLECKTDHSSPPNADVTNAWNFTFFPYASVPQSQVQGELYLAVLHSMKVTILYIRSFS